jgi:hypothetical protein
VLFDPRTTHSFIAAQFATRYAIFKCPIRKKMLISSPGQELTSNYKCPRVGVKIRGKDFLVDFVMVESTGINIILGRG